MARPASWEILAWAISRSKAQYSLSQRPSYFTLCEINKGKCVGNSKPGTKVRVFVLVGGTSSLD
jgi:hypothetical protein